MSAFFNIYFVVIFKKKYDYLVLSSDSSFSFKSSSNESLISLLSISSNDYSSDGSDILSLLVLLSTN
jgi:hypothetical protein